MTHKCDTSVLTDEDDLDSLDRIEDEIEAFACDFCMDSGKLWGMEEKKMVRCTEC